MSILREVLPVSAAYVLRNIIAHDYLGINPEVIVSTVENDLPDLRKSIEAALEQLA